MKKDAALSKGKAAGGFTAENTNMHKLMKMGMDPKTKITGKKTPA